MKQGILFIAPSGARNKKKTVFEEIVSLHSDNDFSPVLYLGPNNYILAAARKQFYSYLRNVHNRSAYIPFQSFTIRQLASDIHDRAGGCDTVSDRIKTLILCRIFTDQNIGYALLLSGLLKNLRHYTLNKDLSQLKEEIQQLIFEDKARVRAVKAVEALQSFEAELKERNVIDMEEVLKNGVSILNRMRAGATSMDRTGPCEKPLRKHRPHGRDKEKISSIVGFETLIIDGFFDPTPLETEMIRGLIDRAENVYVLAEEGTGILKSIQSLESGLTTTILASAVMREKAGFYSFPSMEEEVEWIARSVKKHILEGVSPWDIIVTFPALSRYHSMIRRIFRKHGIPLSIGEYDISHSRPFMALKELIASMAEDYPRHDFLSFLTSPHFPLIPGLIRERAVTYAYRGGIVKGKQSWLSLKDILVGSQQGELSPDELQQLGEFQSGINSIIDSIENIRQKETLLSFIEAFESALNKFGFFDSLEAWKSAADGNDITDIVNNRFSEFKQFARIYETGRHSSDKPEFYLQYLLEDVKGFTDSNDGVKVLPIELAAGLETKVLFLGGMLEGDFPSKPEIDPILPEKVKKALGIPYLEYYLRRQERYFKRLINTSLHEPYISCPTADGEKMYLPSPFLDWEQGVLPETPNIVTEEEVLVAQGFLEGSSTTSAIFRDSETSFHGHALSILRRRIGSMSGGFFNVTDIDFYRRCPLRFYIEKILCLKIDMPPKFEVEAKLWGSLAHKTMEYLFKDKAIRIEQIGAKLFQSLEMSLKQIPIGDFWSKVAREIFRRLLPRLTEQETEIFMKGFRPYRVESKLTTTISTLKLKGKIDRIDVKGEDRRRSAETNKEQRTVILLDYKTGSVNSDSLQMPLYAGLWQQNQSEPVEKAGYYSLKDGSVSWLPRKGGMDEFIREAIRKTEVLVHDMKKGKFPRDPIKPGECRYCYHRPLCSK